jgi:hypothetical protein
MLRCRMFFPVIAEKRYFNMKAIVFESYTGHTKKYAELLGQKTGLPVYERNEASKHLARQDEIIYMGWLMASSIKGYKKAQKYYNVKAVCGVGMRRATEEALKDMTEANKITGTKAFYLQGGYDGNKVRGFYKLLMKMASKFMIDEIEKKEVKTDADLEALDLLKNGGSLVKEENLAPILEWLGK